MRTFIISPTMSSSSFNFDSVSSNSTPDIDADDEFLEDVLFRKVAASRVASESSLPVASTSTNATSNDEGALGLDSIFPGHNAVQQPGPLSLASNSMFDAGRLTFNTVLPHFGNLIKRTMQLTPSEEAKLDLYCEV